MKRLALSLLALILLFEEWLWDLLTVLGQYIDRLVRLERFEEYLRQAAPSIALTAFLIPLLMVAPLNVLAVVFLTHGLLWEAVLMEVAAKLLGTLLLARVFALTKPQLLTYPALAWVYTTITRWLAWAHGRIADTAVYRLAGRLRAEIRARIRAWAKT